MKKYTSFLCILFLLPFFSKVKAQGMMEISGIAPVSQHTLANTIAGGGIAMGLYFKPINIIKPVNTAPSTLALRFGMDYSLAFMGYKHFKDVPLLSPESGNSRVEFTNTLYTANLAARISSSCFDGRVIPYLDVMAGYRAFVSDMTIYPEDKKKESTSSHLAGVKGLNTAAGAGVMVALTSEKNFFLNAGFVVNHSEVPGKFVDMSTLQRSGNSIEYYSRPSIEDFVVVKVGIVGMIDFHSAGGSTSGCESQSTNCWHSSAHCGGGSSHVSIIAH